MGTGRFFAVVVKKRDENTLKPVIEKYIAPGSIIYSDQWAAYNNISEWTWLPPVEGAEIERRYTAHQTVNHSKEFKADDGTHTNAIEGYWRVSKEQIPGKHYCDAETLQEHLFTQSWRKIFEGKLWDGLKETLKVIRYNHKTRLSASIVKDENGIHTVERVEYDEDDEDDESDVYMSHSSKSETDGADSDESGSEDDEDDQGSEVSSSSSSTS